MPRLEQLNGGLARDGLDALAMDDEVFYMWVSAMLEEAARGGAVLVEIRFGVGDGLLADRMHVFRESERRIREHHPYFCAEAIGVVNIGTENAADAFEVCLRARDKGLAGIDIIPSPYEFETTGRQLSSGQNVPTTRDWASACMPVSSRRLTSPPPYGYRE